MQRGVMSWLWHKDGNCIWTFKSEICMQVSEKTFLYRLKVSRMPAASGCKVLVDLLTENRVLSRQIECSQIPVSYHSISMEAPLPLWVSLVFYVEVLKRETLKRLRGLENAT